MSAVRSLLGRPAPRAARNRFVAGITAVRGAVEVLGMGAEAAAVACEAKPPPRLAELLPSIAEDIGGWADVRDDCFGLTWVTLGGGSIDDLAVALGVVVESLERAGLFEQLVCGAVALGGRGGGEPAFLIYNFSTAAFHAFVPRAGGRDLRAERRIEAAIARDVPLEQDRERRYPVWDIPIQTRVTPGSARRPRAPAGTACAPALRRSP